jgi:hypothetical protein
VLYNGDCACDHQAAVSSVVPVPRKEMTMGGLLLMTMMSLPAASP